ncbi:MAG TPA: hypothetical protein VMK66_00035 [Myxococcales bacterium]|nr:hypothetical protein [Myxococcales bacterium]
MLRQTALLVLVAALPAAAAEVRFDGSYRLRFNADSNLVLDETGFASAQKQWFEHRLRLSPKVVEVGPEGGIEFQSSFDILSGEFAGDVAPDFRGLGVTERSERNGFKAAGFDFRYLFADIRYPFGVIKVGQMPSHWGMGMVANSGEGEGTNDFGDARYGDIVERFLFATRPLMNALGPRSDFGREFSVAVAGDLVYRDRYAELLVNYGSGAQWGDIAWQIVGMANWSNGEASRVGLYVVRRIQSYAASGGDLHTWTFDSYARHTFAFERMVLTFEGEGALIYGGTSHSPTAAETGTARVWQQGAALRAGLTRGRFDFELEGGYASGDGNPFDDQQNTFTMNRDYKVGLVLFDQLRMFQSQNTARRLSDPSLAGRPPAGLDLLPTEGAVSNALYFKPTFRIRPRLFGGTLRLVGSMLWARAPQPVVDSYQALRSSAALNAFGYPAGQDYGIEVDAALSFQRKLVDSLGLDLGVQGGYLFPGSAFTRADGTRMPGAWASNLRATLVF